MWKEKVKFKRPNKTCRICGDVFDSSKQMTFACKIGCDIFSSNHNKNKNIEEHGICTNGCIKNKIDPFVCEHCV